MNLLFLYTDEQAWGTLAAYGNNRIEMPNLNRLAEQSVVFDQAYVTQPVCTPSRSSLLTGLYPHTNGCTENNIPLRRETACLPEMLEAGKYVTAHFGKWHLGDEIFEQHGFDEWRSIEDMYRPYYSEGRDRDRRSDYHHFLVENGFEPGEGNLFKRHVTARLPEEYSKPAFLAREASRFIRENRDRPFVLYVNFLEPHMPFFGPRDDQYDPDDIPLPDDFDAVPGESQPLKTRVIQRLYYENGHGNLSLKTEADWRRMIANYWGLCSLVDTHVGTILDALDECLLGDSTIVVFTSDHGDMMGSHRLLAKCVMFEEAVRVPLLVRLPGRTGSKRVGGPVSQIDIVPTLLDLMGQSLPPHLQGKSLRPMLETESDSLHKEDVFIEWNGRNSGVEGSLKREPRPEWMRAFGNSREIMEAVEDPVRTVITPDGWKLNFSPRGEHEMYDMCDDPGETRNLAREAGYRGKLDDLRYRIKQWQKATGDLSATWSP
jgi:arylsulfatase A-like enzyme